MNKINAIQFLNQMKQCTKFKSMELVSLFEPFWKYGLILELLYLYIILLIILSFMIIEQNLVVPTKNKM